MTRVLIYARQSETGGEGERSLSLDSQLAELRRDAARHGWAVVAEIRDADQKGYDPKRPGLLQLYERARAGDVDLVAFWSLSRLARKVRITEEIFDELTALGVALYSNQESWVAEPMMRQVFAAFAEQQTRDIRAHVQRAIRERTRRGLAHGPAPYGYRRGEDGKLVPSDDADALRQMFRWRADGDSANAITARLLALGMASPNGGLWTRQSVESILRNPVYRGTLTLADVTVAGAHPPLIDDDLWRQAHATCTGPRARSPRPKAHRSWLEGLLEHACGAPMYLTGGSPGRPPLTFRCRVGGGWGAVGSCCPHRPRQMPAAQAERMVWQAVTDALSAMPSLSRVTQRARRQYRESAPLADAAIRDARRRQKQAQEGRERVLESYWSGYIDKPVLAAKIASNDAVLAEVAAVLAAVPQPPDAEAIAATWEGLRDLRTALGEYSPQERATVLRTLGGAVVGPAGYRAGRADAGVVTIRVRPELRGFFPE